MTRYVDKVPQADKEKILDLFYGRNTGGLRDALTLDEISRKMNGEYTPAQIKSIVMADIDGSEE